MIFHEFWEMVHEFEMAHLIIMIELLSYIVYNNKIMFDL